MASIAGYRRPRLSLWNSGLFLATNHEILAVDFKPYPKAVWPDSFSSKGFLLVLSKLPYGKTCLVVISHLHSSESDDGTYLYEKIRFEQMKLMSEEHCIQMMVGSSLVT